MRPARGGVFLLAGIWDLWQGKQGERLETVAILTTAANELMQPIHARMPVVLARPDLAAWLAPATDLGQALSLLRPCPAAMMVAYPVSRAVNNARHDGPNCVAPAIHLFSAPPNLPD